jgi:hypothetical protein
MTRCRLASEAYHVLMASKHKSLAENGSIRGTAKEAIHREAEAAHNAARKAHQGFRSNRGQLSHVANEKSREIGVVKDG